MARWFRFYDDALNDPKVQLLEPKLFKAWVNLLCLASQHDGLIPSMTDVSFALRTSETEAGRIIDGLISAGLIDQIEEHLQPHNWRARQFKSDGSTERVKRFRKRFRNVSSAVSETGPDTDTDTDTEVSKKDTRARGALSCALAFDDFWKAWPNKVGKPAALKAFKSAINHGTDPGEIQRGITDYIRDKPPDRPWLNPATFLNQNRWEDEPAKVAYETDRHRPGSLIAAIDRKLAELDAQDETDPELSESPVRLISSGPIR